MHTNSRSLGKKTTTCIKAQCDTTRGGKDRICCNPLQDTSVLFYTQTNIRRSAVHVLAFYLSQNRAACQLIIQRYSR